MALDKKGTLIKVIPHKYNGQVIEILEEALVRARNGEVRQLILMFENDGRNNADGTRDYETLYTGSDDLFSLVGQIERLKFRMMERMVVDDD